MSEDLVLVDRRDGVVTVVLNRPQRKNAITGELVEAAISALHEVARTPEDRALVLTGAGDAFCSGMDLSVPPLPDALTFMRRVNQFCLLLNDLPIPTIAQVAGPAIGFGANLALCCDLVVAAEDARFGEVFAGLGISVDGGGSWTIPRLVGLARAKEILFFGQEISGPDAAAIGLVNRCVPNDELAAATARWAGRLADGATAAIARMKHALNASAQSSFADALEREALAQTVSFGGVEAKVAGRARAAGEVPNFRIAGRGRS